MVDKEEKKQERGFLRLMNVQTTFSRPSVGRTKDKIFPLCNLVWKRGNRKRGEKRVCVVSPFSPVPATIPAPHPSPEHKPQSLKPTTELRFDPPSPRNNLQEEKDGIKNDDKGGIKKIQNAICSEREIKTKDKK